MKTLYLTLSLILGAVTALPLMAEDAGWANPQARRDFARLGEFQQRCQSLYKRAQAVANHYAGNPGSASPAQVADMQRTANNLKLLYRQIPVHGTIRELENYKTTLLKKHAQLYESASTSIGKAAGSV